ncbi:hypothetical protein SISNIDRAFT_491898 [Sistotremastrum niveocremeum HHB9708]|uniref:Uncharacterized protein n=1 Tax=Sistotremastrum niveocremeum HHB9708 TaxID=1314777 RepID=A0A164M9H3_9AGAM|nr:hypothetical protein SISNIDRAFT_491898 [Sistotremastrum niveocremeum HHB9708]
MLASALFANATWRSNAHLFSLESWLALEDADVSFADRLESHTTKLGLSSSLNALFRHFGDCADALAAHFEKSVSLLFECTSSDTGMYPKNTARGVYRNFYLCLICDRLLWSLEVETLAYPPTSYRPHSQPKSLPFFDEYEPLDQILRKFELQLVASAPSNPALSATTSSHVSLTEIHLHNAGGFKAQSGIMESAARMSYWCAITLCALKQFNEDYVQEIKEAVKSSFTAGHQYFVHEEMSDFDFRSILPFYSVITHSPILLLSPSFLTSGRAPRNSNLADWLRHTGVPTVMNVRLITAEKLIWSSLASQLSRGYASLLPSNSSTETLPEPLPSWTSYIDRLSAELLKSPQINSTAIYEADSWPWNLDHLFPHLCSHPYVSQPSQPTQIVEPALVAFSQPPEEIPHSDRRSALQNITAELKRRDKRASRKPAASKTKARSDRNSTGAQQTSSMPQQSNTRQSQNHSPPHGSRDSQIDGRRHLPPPQPVAVNPRHNHHKYIPQTHSFHHKDIWVWSHDWDEPSLFQYRVSFLVTEAQTNTFATFLSDLDKAFPSDSDDASLAVSPAQYYLDPELIDAQTIKEKIVKYAGIHSAENPPVELSTTFNEGSFADHHLSLYTPHKIHVGSPINTVSHTTLYDLLRHGPTMRAGLYIPMVDTTPDNVIVNSVPIRTSLRTRFAATSVCTPPDHSALDPISIMTRGTFAPNCTAPPGMYTVLTSAFGILLVVVKSLISYNPVDFSYSYDLLKMHDTLYFPPTTEWSCYAISDVIFAQNYFLVDELLPRSLRSANLLHLIPRAFNARSVWASEVLLHQYLTDLQWMLQLYKDPEFLDRFPMSHSRAMHIVAWVSLLEHTTPPALLPLIPQTLLQDRQRSAALARKIFIDEPELMAPAKKLLKEIFAKCDQQLSACQCDTCQNRHGESIVAHSTLAGLFS